MKEIRYLTECKLIVSELEELNISSNHFRPTIILREGTLADFARVIFEKDGSFYGASFSLANDYYLTHYGNQFDNGMLNAVQGVIFYGKKEADFTELKYLIDYIKQM